jgi:hypothetical protein
VKYKSKRSLSVFGEANSMKIEFDPATRRRRPTLLISCKGSFPKKITPTTRIIKEGIAGSKCVVKWE